MKYIYDDQSGTTHFQRYFEYLQRIRGKLPKSLYEFAADQSRYALNDPRTMHDSWLVSITVHEGSASGDNRRLMTIDLKLLGPYHDRHFDLRYGDVLTYQFDMPKKTNLPPATGHGDLLYQEFRLTDDEKNLCHEIQFSSGRRLYVECREIAIHEVPTKTH